MPCNPTYFRDKFREYLAEVDGVRLLTPYSCRHTYVSQLQALGIDVSTIQALCGHAEMDMTQHYLHVQDNVKLAAVERFGEEFGRVSEPDENSNIMELTGSSVEKVNKDDAATQLSPAQQEGNQYDPVTFSPNKSVVKGYAVKRLHRLIHHQPHEFT